VTDDYNLADDPTATILPWIEDDWDDPDVYVQLGRDIIPGTQWRRGIDRMIEGKIMHQQWQNGPVPPSLAHDVLLVRQAPPAPPVEDFLDRMRKRNPDNDEMVEITGYDYWVLIQMAEKSEVLIDADRPADNEWCERVDCVLVGVTTIGEAFPHKVSEHARPADTPKPTCTTCDGMGRVPVSGRGEDGFDPCPDCGPAVLAEPAQWTVRDVGTFYATANGLFRNEMRVYLSEVAALLNDLEAAPDPPTAQRTDNARPERDHPGMVDAYRKGRHDALNAPAAPDLPNEVQTVINDARELVRASAALLCDYTGERGIWWDGFRDALTVLRRTLGLNENLTDTDMLRATTDRTDR